MNINRILGLILVKTGYRRPLVVNDIWLINPSRRTSYLAAKLEANFQNNHKNGVRRPLAWAIFQTFKADLIIGGVAAFTSAMIQVLVPFVLKYIIAYAVQDYDASSLGVPGPAVGRGIGLVLSITVMQIFGSMGYNHFFYRGMLVGGQVRSALISMIFDKAMTISGRAKAGGNVEPLPPGTRAGSDEEKRFFRNLLAKRLGNGADKSRLEAWGNGRIVNLMSVDTSRIDQASGWFHMVWTVPVAMVVTIILLLVNLSYSALAGLALFFAAIPLVAYIVRAMIKRRKKINKDTDERVTMMQEILQAIRFVKYYAWESDFLARLGAIRQREIRGIRYLLALRNTAISMGSAIPIFSSMLTFITSSLTNHSLEPASTFSSLALFNQLRLPLIMFPMVLGLVADALQSLARLEQFFLAEDSVDPADDCPDGVALNLVDASFIWERSSALTHSGRRLNGQNFPSSDQADRQVPSASQIAAPDHERESERPPFMLDNINLRSHHSELIGIVGSVGSGKSSLLSAIAGDMRQLSGILQTKSKRALCAQVAWILNSTVRENITFGREFVKEDYDRVVKACALGHDLDVLPNGDFTEIGERGINLSGGQKQRISLARAIYSDADVVLLDDPLGAVDPHVGAHIMDHAICGLLKNKCRILVTHQLHVLPRCDRVVVMDRGILIACDTFQNLITSNSAFQQMMVNVDTERRPGLANEAEQKSTQPSPSRTTKAAAEKSLMTEEDRQVNGIGRAVYLNYLKSTGSLSIPPLVLLVLLVAQGGNILTNLWLAWWSSNRFGLSSGVYVSVKLVFSQGAIC